MNVDAIATKSVITLSVNDSLLDASRLLRENGIRHLPVVEGDGRLVGIVTDRDIKQASASEATSLDIHELMYLLDKLQVSKVMKKNPLTVGSGTSVRDAAKLMVEKKIGCLPVVDGGRLTGIITEIDMLKLLAQGAP